jgi:hypothetical protein
VAGDTNIYRAHDPYRLFTCEIKRGKAHAAKDLYRSRGCRSGSSGGFAEVKRLPLRDDRQTETHLQGSGTRPGTLNISIAPKTFVLTDPEYTFRQVAWTDLHPPEDFSFSRCKVVYKGKVYEGCVYYPHPETKKRHFQDASILEVLAEHIPDLKYGDQIEVELKSTNVFVSTGIK